MLKEKRLFLVVVFLVFISLSSLEAAGEINSRCCDEEYPKIIVQGEGKVEALADKAYFSIKIRTEEKKLEKAFEESAKKINSVQEALVTFGIKKEDIQNLGYVYYPLYEGKKIFTTLDRPTSYEVIYSLKVTVYDLDNLGKILVKVSEIAETSVYGLTYTSTKIEELKREALKKAAENARERAIKLVEGAGAVLGKVIKIESREQVYPVFRKDYAYEGVAVARLEESKAVPQIESGNLEIISNCTIYFSLQ